MKEKELASCLEVSLSRLLSWIGAADSKTHTIFAFNTAMLGVLAALAPAPSLWPMVGAIWACVAALSSGASLMFCTFASFPRTSGPKGSVVYFEGIANHESSAYAKKIKDLTLDAYIEDLAAQCHRNAQIASAKFTWVRNAVVALYVAVVPWLGAVYCLYRGTES